TWNGSMPSGGSVTISIVATINAGTGGTTISNQGTHFFDADNNGTNESSLVTDDPSTAASSDPTQFQVLALPTVTAISPTSGPTAGGTSVTITGTGFTGATAVTFGGTAAGSFTVNSDTQVTALGPAHAAGTVDIIVTAPGGTSATAVADHFTFVAPPKPKVE